MTVTLPWEDMARVAMHPIQIRVLEILHEAPDDTPLSPSNIAEQMYGRKCRTCGYSSRINTICRKCKTSMAVNKLGNVSYHVRQLHDARLLIEAGTEPVRGTLEHFYKAAL